MHTRRGRLRSCVEWTIATALLAGLIAIGLNLVGGVQRVAPMPTVRDGGAPLLPAAIPARAVSVPLITLAGNVRIQVGEFAADVFARIQNLTIAGADAVERRAGGERVVREFAHPGGRFHLVTESTTGDAPRVVGIFVP